MAPICFSNNEKGVVTTIPLQLPELQATCWDFRRDFLHATDPTKKLTLPKLKANLSSYEYRSFLISKHRMRTTNLSLNST